jgi:hypothetical protein
MVSKRLSKHFKDFGSRVKKLHAKFDKASCSILPSFTEKTKNEVEKALVQKLCVHRVVSHARLMPAEVWPWPPLSSSYTSVVTTITVRELSDRTS